MNVDFDFRVAVEVELWLAGPREGDETEVIEKGGDAGESKRVPNALVAFDPREGDETEETERGGGSVPTAQGPREGDETTPVKESPLGPPVQT